VQASCVVLDMFLFDGRKVLFQVALAIFKTNKEMILKETYGPSIFKKLRDKSNYRAYQNLLKVTLLVSKA
jgi:hypothetical protein